mmetsp:Transcript_27556/g.38036  ORF Transcript_27556/g.38036 Transcript_27556/m.38036 type:complete len:205 (+) Transcript_27556:433-1047(+)
MRWWPCCCAGQSTASRQKWYLPFFLEALAATSPSRSEPCTENNTCTEDACTLGRQCLNVNVIPPGNSTAVLGPFLNSGAPSTSSTPGLRCSARSASRSTAEASTQNLCRRASPPPRLTSPAAANNSTSETSPPDAPNKLPTFAKALQRASVLSAPTPPTTAVWWWVRAACRCRVRARWSAEPPSAVVQTHPHALAPIRPPLAAA